MNASTAVYAHLPRVHKDAEIDREIARFLSGETDGRAVLSALYPGVEKEPIPARLLAVVRRPGNAPGPLPPAPGARILPFVRAATHARRA